MYHKITLIGNLGRDPEMRYTPSGQAVCNFSMATTEKWTGQDGQMQERTLWWRVSVFGKQAETCNTYLKKGSKIYLEGRLTGDPSTGGPKLYQKKDGGYGASFDVTANTVKFLSSRGETGAVPAGGGGGGMAGHEPVGDESDEIPF
ncbi:MAG: single-stranded DNA-binding protein [Anaerolineales bacterium]|nr:single-stranded DNA-binding protein [Anaerolineales bacterium]